MCGIHCHAVRAEYVRGEIALLHCVRGDQPLEEVFRVNSKFFQCLSLVDGCRAIEVFQAANLDTFVMSFMPYSFRVQRALCVSCNALPIDIDLSVSVSKNFVPEVTTSPLRMSCSQWR
jgi:hypothetical protein